MLSAGFDSRVRDVGARCCGVPCYDGAAVQCFQISSGGLVKIISLFELWQTSLVVDLTKLVP